MKQDPPEAKVKDAKNPRNRWPGRLTDCLNCRQGNHEECTNTALERLRSGLAPCQCGSEYHSQKYPR